MAQNGYPYEFLLIHTNFYTNGCLIKVDNFEGAMIWRMLHVCALASLALLHPSEENKMIMNAMRHTGRVRRSLHLIQGPVIGIRLSPQ